MSSPFQISLEEIKLARQTRECSLEDRQMMNHSGIQTVMHYCNNEKIVNLYKRIVEYAAKEDLTFIDLEAVTHSYSRDTYVVSANFDPYAQAIFIQALPINISKNMEYIIFVLAHELGHFIDNKTRTSEENESLANLYVKVYNEKDKTKRLKFKNKIISLEKKAWEFAEIILNELDSEFLKCYKVKYEADKNSALKTYLNM